MVRAFWRASATPPSKRRSLLGLDDRSLLVVGASEEAAQHVVWRLRAFDVEHALDRAQKLVWAHRLQQKFQANQTDLG